MISQRGLSYEDFEEEDERDECYYGLEECIDVTKRDTQTCLGCWVIAPVLPGEG